MSALAASAALYRWLGIAAGVAMLALLAWLGADIFWTLNAPESASPSALMETDPQRAAQGIGGRHLFGVSVAAAAAAPSNIRLNGVIAAQKPGQRAYALITLEGKPAQLVREGEELAPGITLQRVLARQVELMRSGQSQTLSLPESGKPQGEGGKSLLVNNLTAAEPPKAVAEIPPALAPPAVTAPLLQSAPPLPRRGRTRRSSEDE